MQVVCLDKMDYVASLNNLSDIADRPNYKVSLLLLASADTLDPSQILTITWCLQFIKGDIQSGDLLRYVMDTEGIDTVMHFAAQVGSQLLAGRTSIKVCPSTHSIRSYRISQA